MIVHLSKRLFSHRIKDTDHVFLFNPLSGALDLADESDISMLDRILGSGSDDAISPEIINNLRDRKMLFDTAAEEELYLEGCVLAARERMQTKQPSLYTVCPTLTCNLDCDYCFEGPTSLKPKGVMSSTDVDEMFAAIHQLEKRRAIDLPGVELPVPWISIFGGEPLQATTLKSVEQILSISSRHGYYTTVTSNGVGIKRFKELLTRYSPVGSHPIIAAFQVTIDGPKAIHDVRRPRLGGQGSFDAIVEGIDILLSLQIFTTLRVNIDANNIDSLPDLCEFIKSKGWHETELLEVSVAPVVVHAPKGTADSYAAAIDELSIDQQIVRLVEQHPLVGEICDLGHLRCLDHLSTLLEPSRTRSKRAQQNGSIGARYWYCEQGTYTQWVFTPDHHIYTCTEAVGKTKHAIGRFSPDLEIWEDQASDWLGRTILSNPTCRTCNIATLCGGGCHFAAREKAGLGSLIQISMAGGKDRKPMTLAASAGAVKQIDPYCANAEGTVRAYLDIMGPRILQSYGL